MDNPRPHCTCMNSFLSSIACIIVALLTASCMSQHSTVSKRSTAGSPPCVNVITNAVNRGDWDTLRKLAKPGMRANDYITMWENSQRSGHAVHVGKLKPVDRDAQFNGERCTKYSFTLENEDGTAGPHQLQILVQEQGRESQLLDFWNFGW
jgi:hypothetical protein